MNKPTARMCDGCGTSRTDTQLFDYEFSDPNTTVTGRARWCPDCARTAARVYVIAPAGKDHTHKDGEV